MRRRNIVYVVNYSKETGEVNVINNVLPQRLHLVKGFNNELKTQIEEDLRILCEDCKNVKYSLNPICRISFPLASTPCETVYIPVRLGDVAFMPLSLRRLPVTQFVEDSEGWDFDAECECMFSAE